jgi:hypothetical protein
MDPLPPNGSGKAGALVEAARFWEPRRLWYNGILTLIVLLWLILTWPHFRSALTLVALGKMMVLAGLANVCYWFAYGTEFFIQGVLPRALWRRFRFGVLVLGMLAAMVLENYWIADEIYPDMPPPAAVHLGEGANAMGTPARASNMNFPAPLAILGFLGACGGLFLGIGAAVIFWGLRASQNSRAWRLLRSQSERQSIWHCCSGSRQPAATLHSSAGRRSIFAKSIATSPTPSSR